MIKKQEVKKSMETKENESGRSMVETLDILAVMVVLSIGGVAGYRWAMGKYHTAPGLVTVALMSCEDECIIKTEECEGDNPTGFKLNNGTCIRCSCSCMLDNNARQDNSTSQGNCSVCDGQNGRDKRYYMNGSCYKTCPTGSTANEATQTCVPESGYLCDVDGPCYSCSYSDYVSVGRSDEGKAMCLSCDGTNGTTKRYYMNGYCYQTCPAGSTANEATQECVPESGYFCDAYGYCYRCSDSSSEWVGRSDEGKAMCLSCDGTNGTTKRYYLSGRCYQTCPAGSTANEATQECVPESGYLCDAYGSCYSCSCSDYVSVGSSDAGKAACLSCNTGSDKRLYGTDGYCYSCSYSGTVEVGTTDEGKAACLSCDGTNGTTKRFYLRGYCYRCSESWNVVVGTTDEGKAACLSCDGTNGTTKRFYSRGYCYRCSDSSSVNVGTTDEGKAACLSCDGTNGTTKRYYWKGDCLTACPANTTANETTQECVPESGYFCDAFGYCYRCSDSSSKWVGISDEGKAMCLLCDGTNGTTKRYYWKGDCYKTCPSGSKVDEATQECVWDGETNCIGGFCSCSDSNLSQYIGTSSEAQSYCASCDGTDGKTQRFYGTDGYCYSCSYSSGEYVGETDEGKAMCHSCNTGANKRYYSNGWCYKCPTSLDLRLIALRTQEKCEQCGGAWDGSKCS